MKLRQLELLLIACGILLGRASLLAAEGASSAYLAFACDGAAREQRVVQEQSATWIVNHARAFAPTVGRVVYRVPVGTAQLDILRIEANLLPYRLEFSGDGERWEILITTAGIVSNPSQFTEQAMSFTAAQCEAARASGFAWFRIRPAGESPSEVLLLQYFRLDVRGAELPPQFVRPYWWRQFIPYAAGCLMVIVGVVPLLIVWRWWRIPWQVWGGGAALWVVSIVLKFVAGLAANGPVNRWLHAGLPQPWADPVYWCYVGSLTGVFECGIFLVAAPRIKQRQWSWREALSLGLGFGAMEALAAGALFILLAGQTGTWGCLTSSAEALSPAFERLITLPIHAAAAVMILRALKDRKWSWFWAAFVYKSVVDSVAMWLTLSGTSLLYSLWLREWLCFAPFALIGVLVLLYLRRTWMPSE